jgi:hypothetical protein
VKCMYASLGCELKYKVNFNEQFAKELSIHQLSHEEMCTKMCINCRYRCYKCHNYIKMLDREEHQRKCKPPIKRDRYKIPTSNTYMQTLEFMNYGVFKGHNCYFVVWLLWDTILNQSITFLLF